LGVKERQEREREAVSRSILDAARDLFVAEGYHNVSIRKIAERIEYSPAAIYGYFPSKDDIFFALAEEGFRTLLAMPAAKVDEADDLKAIRNAFWRVHEMKTRLGARIQRAIDAGHFPAATEPDAVFRILLTAIHGAAVCRLCDRGMPGEDLDALARDTLEAALTGLRTGFEKHYVPVNCAKPID
jgi:AcrR family transcriptional regulator